MNSAHLFALLTLFVAWVDCFSWDIVVSEDNQLQFYNNGTLSHTEFIPSAKKIHSIAYDPVHYRVLFSDYQSSIQQISSFDLSTWNIQPLITRTSGLYLSFVYDPVTELLFFLEGWDTIYSFSLNPASSTKAVDGNLIITSNDFCRDIAVDSCGGYIYWATDKEIERARFDGSEREILINSTFTWRMSLIIDQQTQKMYWTERIHSSVTSLESADFNGNNRRTLYTNKNEDGASSLTVSNDFIYWHGGTSKAIWQLPKNLPQHLVTKQFSTSNNSNWYYHVIAANYTIKQQLKGNQNCKTLKILIPYEVEPDCIDVMLCVHGTKVSGDSRCECIHGFTGEKCDISVCQNYCLQGNCSVSAEGQPICSCKAEYSGQRCEVNACHGYCLNSGFCSLNEEDAPVCQCTKDYEGERCSVPICKDYCFQGNCNISAEGQPICSCIDGYSGERCEFNACHDYCFNNGVCFLNEEKQTVCQCTADYEGERCDIAVTHIVVNGDNMTQQILRELRSEVTQVIKEELQSILRSEVKKVITEELQYTLRFYSDKNDEYEAKIQKLEKSMKDLENHSVGLENHDEISSKTLSSNTFLETN